MVKVFELRSSFDGLPLSVMTVEPPAGRPRAIIQFAHGMRGCKERFLPMFEYMAENGFLCVANDHRGHGASVLSPDDLGYMYAGGFRALVSDMKDVTDWVRSAFPDTPVFLIAHSMGSLAARIYAYEYGSALSGLFVVGSPSYNPLSFFGRIFIGLLCRVGGGRLRLSLVQRLMSGRYNRNFKSEGPEAWTCSDPRRRREFAENPLCNYDFTANACHNLLCMMRETYSSGKSAPQNPSLPVFFLSGKDDPCMIDYDSFLRAIGHMKNHGYKSVESRIYPAMRHEILNEKDRLLVWRDILDIIDDNC